MLEYIYRFSVKPGKMTDFLAWLDDNEAGMDEHSPPGWRFAGAWFVVRGFGAYDCEFRFDLDGYAALGAGFGDAENVARLGEFFGEFVDHTHRPAAVLLKTRDNLSIVEGA